MSSRRRSSVKPPRLSSSSRSSARMLSNLPCPERRHMHSVFQMMPAWSFRLMFLAISLMGLLWPLAAGSRQDPAKPAEQKPEQREDVISLDTSQVIMNVTVTDVQERYVAG